MRKLNALLFLCLACYTFSCVSVKDDAMKQKIQNQLAVIDSLLRSAAFSTEIAKAQDSAYYTGIGEPVPPFLTAAEDSAVITKNAKEEKIATNLAGFYALECGLGALCNQTKEKPTTWLEKII